MVEFKIEDNDYPYEIGILPNRHIALSFVDYLQSKNIKAITRISSMSDAYSVFVSKKEDISEAKLLLIRFGQNPFAKEFNQASWQNGSINKAPKILNENFLSTLLALKHTPISAIVCLMCIIFYLYSLVDNNIYSTLALLSIDQVTVNYQLYKLVTPIFMHFSLMHILFNLIIFIYFANRIERSIGHLKLILLILISAICSNLLQLMFISYNEVFGGLSGVVYALIAYGALVSKRADRPYSFFIPNGILLVSLIMVLIGFVFFTQANFCHLGGLAIGLIFGVADFKAKRLFK